MYLISKHTKIEELAQWFKDNKAVYKQWQLCYSMNKSSNSNSNKQQQKQAIVLLSKAVTQGIKQ